MSDQAQIGGRLGMSGAFECRDKDGNVIKTITFTGSIPLSQLDMSEEQAQALVDQQEAANGSNDQ